MIGNTSFQPLLARAACAESPKRARSAGGARPLQAAYAADRAQLHRTEPHPPASVAGSKQAAFAYDRDLHNRTEPRPPAHVLAFRETKRLADERHRDEDEIAAPFDLAVVAHTPHRHPRVVLRRVQPAAPRPRRGAINR